MMDTNGARWTALTTRGRAGFLSWWLSFYCTACCTMGAPNGTSKSDVNVALQLQMMLLGHHCPFLEKEIGPVDANGHPFGIHQAPRSQIDQLTVCTVAFSSTYM